MLISKCLENDRERRYQTASEIRADLLRLKGTGERALASSRLQSRARWRVIVPAAAAALALLVAAYFYLHRAPKVTDKDTIILADFTNSTGDPVFDGTLRQGLAVQLEQSPFLSLISDERIQRVLRLMGRPADTRLTPELAREICERTDSSAVLEGSIASLGSSYVLGLRAKNCRTGDVLAHEQVQATKKEDVLDALSQMASRFRTRVGESLATVEQYSVPLDEATTPSLEALKSYSAALKISFSTGGAEAVPLLKRATEIDPEFAMAHASLGRLYSNLGEAALSTASITKAYKLRNRVSDRENFFITYNYHREVTRNLELARQTLESWAEKYPRDLHAHAFQSGMTSQGSGRYDRSIEEANKAIKIDPDGGIPYANLACSYIYVNRLGEAEATLQRAAERNLTLPDFTIMRYFIAFLRRDKAGMEREAAQRQGKPAAQGLIPHQEALVLA